MDKPILLDLFSGAGGAARGYQQAGFYVVGVDIEPQPRYCGDEFIQADALEYLDNADLSRFSVLHGSPLCQGFTQMLNWNEQIKEKYHNFIPAIRERFQATGRPDVIENVEGARDHLVNPIMLCGNMFGLRVYRHRLFEVSPEVMVLHHPHVKHRAKAARSGKIARPDEFWCPVGNFGQKDDAQRAMGIDWMKTTGSKDREIAQAIPPAYTCYIGYFLMASIRNECEVVA
jgi:DNA (cytosine-5)-methyltransferase 1